MILEYLDIEGGLLLRPCLKVIFLRTAVLVTLLHSITGNMFMCSRSVLKTSLFTCILGIYLTFLTT